MCAKGVCAQRVCKGLEGITQAYVATRAAEDWYVMRKSTFRRRLGASGTCSMLHNEGIEYWDDFGQTKVLTDKTIFGKLQVHADRWDDFGAKWYCLMVSNIDVIGSSRGTWVAATRREQPEAERRSSCPLSTLCPSAPLFAFGFNPTCRRKSWRLANGRPFLWSRLSGLLPPRPPLPPLPHPPPPPCTPPLQLVLLPPPGVPRRRRRKCRRRRDSRTWS